MAFHDNFSATMADILHELDIDQDMYQMEGTMLQGSLHEEAIPVPLANIGEKPHEKPQMNGLVYTQHVKNSTVVDTPSSIYPAVATLLSLKDIDAMAIDSQVTPCEVTPCVLIDNAVNNRGNPKKRTRSRNGLSIYYQKQTGKWLVRYAFPRKKQKYVGRFTTEKDAVSVGEIVQSDPKTFFEQKAHAQLERKILNSQKKAATLARLLLSKPRKKYKKRIKVKVENPAVTVVALTFPTSALSYDFEV